ncbi:hypothetical protein HaLaN_17482 [Haematococcus lacustris]|uniref:Uncharacterized protein n=1 Tax=Haematococcus lacustris TaxID=44745 RepID=A0A699ZCP8_HAELA|nr:hypothetical protein HaLaN_17482 [Haematococcus lacustris]
MATLVRPGPGSPRRPIASSQQDPHPLSRQEKVDAGDVVLVKTVVDYCVLHKLSLNKNFATKTWADISVITRNACECKTLWHKFTQSFRQIHAYINKHTGGGLPFFEQDDETRKQLANLGGKCKNMKQEMYDLMAPVMANDSATAPLCLVSGGVDTGVYKRGRGRVDSSDEDEEEDEDIEIIEARLHAEARKGYNEVPGEQREQGRDGELVKQIDELALEVQKLKEDLAAVRAPTHEVQQVDPPRSRAARADKARRQQQQEGPSAPGADAGQQQGPQPGPSGQSRAGLATQQVTSAGHTARLQSPPPLGRINPNPPLGAEA